MFAIESEKIKVIKLIEKKWSNSNKVNLDLLMIKLTITAEMKYYKSFEERKHNKIP